MAPSARSPLTELRRHTSPAEIEPDQLRSRVEPDRDRLTPRGNWTRGGVVSAYGLRIGIRADTDDRFAALARMLPPGSIASRGRGGRVDRLYSASAAGHDGQVDIAVDDGVVMPAVELQSGIEWVEGDLHHYVATFSRRLLFVHAGVVGWCGRAILVPGTSFAGKTTLVHAMVEAGARYYSDEYAVFGHDGLVRSFPRHLRMRTPEGLPGWRLDPQALTGRVGGPPIPLALVAAVRYDAKAGWDTRLVSGATGMLAILANTVAARNRPIDAMQMLGRAIQGATLLEGSRGEVEDAATRLLAMVES